MTPIRRLPRTGAATSLSRMRRVRSKVRKMSRSFELSPNGQQLYETLHIDAAKSKPAVYLSYVYDIPPPQPTHATDPDQPVMKRRSDDSTSASGTQGAQSGGQSDPNQPVMKRRTDDSTDSSASQGTQASDSMSSSQATQAVERQFQPARLHRRPIPTSP